MRQEYDRYTTEDHEVWSILFKRQRPNISKYASTRYNEALDELHDVFHEGALPKYEVLDQRLTSATGWQIEVVPGLIEIDQFYSLLAKKRFPASTWVRPRTQLDYLEEPDMFHDSFGHLPLLIDTTFSDFTYRLGQLGLQYHKDPNKLIELQRLYWFTLEFGLIKEDGLRKAYGAGLMSSSGEISFSVSDEPEVNPFDLKKVIATSFDNMKIQERYFMINSFDDLHNALDEWEKQN